MRMAERRESSCGNWQAQDRPWRGCSSGRRWRGRHQRPHARRLLRSRDVAHDRASAVRAHDDAGQYDVDVNVGGGGVAAQATAIRHGITRALLLANPELRGPCSRRPASSRATRARSSARSTVATRPGSVRSTRSADPRACRRAPTMGLAATPGRRLSVAVLGATGYAGVELVRLLAGTRRSSSSSSRRSSTGAVGPRRCIRSWPATWTCTLGAPDPDGGGGAPTSSSPRCRTARRRRVVAEMLGRGGGSSTSPPTFDCGIRRSTRAGTPTHPAPELLAEAVYGLPELYRAEIAGARLVAVSRLLSRRGPSWVSRRWPERGCSSSPSSSTPSPARRAPVGVPRSSSCSPR